MNIRELRAAAVYSVELDRLCTIRDRLSSEYRPCWSVGDILLDDHALAAMMPGLKAEIEGRIAVLQDQLVQRGIVFDD